MRNFQLTIFVILTLTTKGLFAQTEGAQTFSWATQDIYVGSVLELPVEHEFDELNCANKQIESLDLIVWFDHGENYDLGQFVHTVDVEFELKLLDINGATLLPQQGAPTSFTEELHISQDVPQSYFLREELPPVYYQDLAKVSLMLNDLIFDPNHEIPVRITIELIPTFTVDADESASNQQLSLTDPYLNMATGQYRFEWNSCGFENASNPFPSTGLVTAPSEFPAYMFQLLKLENTILDFPQLYEDPNLDADFLQQIDEAAITAQIDWRQALTVTLTNGQKFLDLTLTEGEGYYIWRVMPLGNSEEGGEANPDNWGPWSSIGALDDNGGFNEVSSVQLPYLFLVGNGLDNYDDLHSKNWIHGRVLTEGSDHVVGVRAHESMTFANGLQQVQQEQTRLGSQANIVASQTFYDFSGRPVLKSLPAPAGLGGQAGGLDYISNFAENQFGDFYTASDFDLDPDNDPGTAGDWRNPEAMFSSNGGPLSYYESSNGDPLVSTATDYPFTRTVFTKDNTGRIKFQAGAGEVFTMKPEGSGVDDKTVRTYYVPVADQELIRIFGAQAPKNTAVFKQIAVDPNTVISISYIDKDGRTLATCLSDATEPPALLPSSESLDFSPPYTISELSQTGDFSFQGTAYLVVVEEGFSLDYLNFDLNPEVVSSCLESTCATCDYKVEINIVNAITGDIQFPVGSNAVEIDNFDDLVESCDPASIPSLQHSSSIVPLPVGEYYINLFITTNNTPPGAPMSNMDQMLEDYEDAILDAFDLQFQEHIDANLTPASGDPLILDFLSDIGVANPELACEQSHDENNPVPITVPFNFGDCEHILEVPCTDCSENDISDCSAQMEYDDYVTHFYNYWVDQLPPLNEFGNITDPTCADIFNPALLTYYPNFFDEYPEADYPEFSEWINEDLMFEGSFPGAGHAMLGGRTVGEFNTILVEVRNSLGNTPDDCERFWGCWEAITQAYANSCCAAGSVDPGDYEVPPNEMGVGETETPDPAEPDLLTMFLDCFGGWETAYITTDTELINDHPQSYMVYDQTDANLFEDCIASHFGQVNGYTFNDFDNDLNVNDPLAIVPNLITASQFDNFLNDPNTDALMSEVYNSSDPNENLQMFIESFRGCVEGGMPAECDPCNEQDLIDLLENGQEQVLEQCYATCDARESSFYNEIVDAHHRHGISIDNDEFFLTNEMIFEEQGTAPNNEFALVPSPDTYTLDMQSPVTPGYVWSEHSENWDTPTGEWVVPHAEVLCMTQSLIGHCYDQCNLAVPPPPEPGNFNAEQYYESMNPDLLAQVMSAPFAVDLPDANGDCPNGFTEITPESVLTPSTLITDLQFSGVDKAYRSPNNDLSAGGIMLNGYLWLAGTVDFINAAVSGLEWEEADASYQWAENAWLVKVDPNTYQVLDQWHYGGQADDRIVKILSDGLRIFLVGHTSSSEGPVGVNDELDDCSSHTVVGSPIQPADVWVACVDQVGDMIWQRTYGGEQYELATNAQLEGDKLVVLATSNSFANPPCKYSEGYMYTDGEGVDHIAYHNWVLAIDVNAASSSQGDILWDHALAKPLTPSELAGSGAESAQVATMLEVIGTDVLIGGNCERDVNYRMLYKFSSNNIAWGGNNFNNSMIQEVDTDLPLFSRIYEAYQFSGGNIVDPLGAQDPSEEGLFSTDWQYFGDVLPTDDGGYIIASRTRSAAGNSPYRTAPNHGKSDVWLLKVDANLNYVWDRCYGSSTDEGNGIPSLYKTPTGQLIIIDAALKTDAAGLSGGNREDEGTLGAPMLTWDYWLILTDQDGNYISDFCTGAYTNYTPTPQTVVGVNGASHDVPMGFVDLGNGKISVPGVSTSTDYGDRSESTGGGLDIWMPIIDLSETNCGHDPFCFSWVEPRDLSNADPIEPFTCEDFAAQAIMNSLEMQLWSIIEDEQAVLEDEYIAQCVYNIHHTFEYAYKLKYRHYTLYYYDRAGNLVKTVPPEGVDLLDGDPNDPAHPIGAYDPDLSTRDFLPQHRMVTEYHYNSLGQLVRQETPDGGETHFMYNGIGQLRFSQNAEQVVDGEYAYTKYDALGRVVEVGKLSGNMLQSNANNINFPITSGDEWARTTYSEVVQFPPLLGLEQTYVKNRVSYTENYVGVKTYYSYDPHGNVKWIAHSIPGLCGPDEYKVTYYEYDLINGNVLKVTYQPDSDLERFMHRYNYDEDNRITLVETSTDDIIWEKDARYEYYLHGPLKRVVTGEDLVQGTDYTYTLQGWLKGLNHPDGTLDPGEDGVDDPLLDPVARDAFSMMLHYHDKDFTKANSQFDNTVNPLEVSLDGTTSLYNGNIAAWTSNMDVGDLQNLPTSFVNNTLQGWKYKYDDLNRIRIADFATFNSTWDLSSDDYHTEYTYDKNGNLKTLDRNSYDADEDDLNGIQNEMDRLLYKYPLDVDNLVIGNRLLSVAEDPASVNDIQTDDIEQYHHYEYDENGNLVKEYKTLDPATYTPSNLQMTVDWNLQGKVAAVTKADPNEPQLSFMYDASGNRIKKRVEEPSGVTETYYVRDAQGNVMAIYEKKIVPITSPATGVENTLTVTERPIYGSSRIGENTKKNIIYQEQVLDNGTVMTEDLLVDRIAEQNVMPLVGPIFPTLPLQFTDEWNVEQNPAQNGLAFNLSFGNNGANSVVAESRDGVKVFTGVISTPNSDWGWLEPGYILLWGANGNLYWNSWDIKASPSSSALAMECHWDPRYWYLFTQDDKGFVYYHVVDVYDQQVDYKNIPLIAGQQYSKGMALIADHTDVANSRLFLKQDNGSIGNMYSLEIYEGLLDPLGAPLQASDLDFEAVYPTCNTARFSEVQVSPDGTKIAITGQSQKKIHKDKWFYGPAWNEPEAILVYELDENHRVTPPHPNGGNIYTWPPQPSDFSDTYAIHHVGNRMPDSHDFSPSGENIYYRSSQMFTIFGYGTKLRRWTMGGSAVDIAEALLGEVRRGANGHMYAPIRDFNLPYYNNGWFFFTPINALLDVESPDILTTPSYTTHSGFQFMNIYSSHMRLQPHRIYPIDGPQRRLLGNKVYELTDHLGNVRSVISDRKLSDITFSYDVNSNIDGIASIGNFRSDVRSLANFYPFGMHMPGRQANTTDYRFGFGGHEKDGEIKTNGNYLSFGEMGYSPRLGKRWRIDPKFNELPGASPYSYALGNPIMLNDPDGEIPLIPILLWAGRRAAAGAVTDLLVQLGTEWVANGGSIGDAWDRLEVDGFQMARSAGENLVKGKYTAAALSAGGDMLQYMMDNEDWTWEGALLAAGEGGLSSILGDKLAGALLKKIKVKDGVIFSADLSKSKATTRGGHRNAANKQLKDAMDADPNTRELIEMYDADAYEKVKRSVKDGNKTATRKNPEGLEWDHNNDEKYQIDLKTAKDHLEKTIKDGTDGGGFKRNWSDSPNN